MLVTECPICHNTNYYSADSPACYIRVCERCRPLVFVKMEYLKNFTCKKCKNKEGEIIEDNDTFNIKCKKCNETSLIFKKYLTTLDGVARLAEAQKIINRNKVVSCPKCGSTQITTGRKGISFTMGLLGANKTVNRCANCGNAWTPKK